MKKILLFVTIFTLNFNLYAEEKKAYFAGGCFWCMEESFDQVEGVLSSISGYSKSYTFSLFIASQPRVATESQMAAIWVLLQPRNSGIYSGA